MWELAISGYGKHRDNVIFLSTNNLPIRLLFKSMFNKAKQLQGFLLEVHDANQFMPLSEQQIQRVIDCKPSEAKVIAGLLLHKEVPSIATDVGLSEHTVRIYIKQVMKRNKFARQVDLIQYLTRCSI